VPIKGGLELALDRQEHLPDPPELGRNGSFGV
jgi:hypothetical protein